METGKQPVSGAPFGPLVQQLVESRAEHFPRLSLLKRYSSDSATTDQNQDPGMEAALKRDLPTRPPGTSQRGHELVDAPIQLRFSIAVFHAVEDTGRPPRPRHEGGPRCAETRSDVYQAPGARRVLPRVSPGKNRVRPGRRTVGNRPRAAGTLALRTGPDALSFLSKHAPKSEVLQSVAGYWRIDVEAYLGSLDPLNEVGEQWVALMRNTADRLDRLSPIEQSWRLTPGMPFLQALRYMVNELDAAVTAKYRAMGPEAYDAYLRAKSRSDTDFKAALDEATAAGQIADDVQEEVRRIAAEMDTSTLMIDALDDPAWVERLRDEDGG